MDSSTLDATISTLEKSASGLEGAIDGLEKWLWVSSVAVAIGVTLEVYFLIRAYRSERQDWIKAEISAPSKPNFRVLIFEVASVLLVVAGIVGELWVGVISANKNSELRGVNTQLIGLIREKAGDAELKAANARAGNIQLGITLENAKHDLELAKQDVARAKASAAGASSSRLAIDFRIVILAVLRAPFFVNPFSLSAFTIAFCHNFLLITSILRLLLLLWESQTIDPHRYTTGVLGALYPSSGNLFKLLFAAGPRAGSTTQLEPY